MKSGIACGLLVALLLSTGPALAHELGEWQLNDFGKFNVTAIDKPGTFGDSYRPDGDPAAWVYSGPSPWSAFQHALVVERTTDLTLVLEGDADPARLEYPRTPPGWYALMIGRLDALKRVDVLADGARVEEWAPGSLRLLQPKADPMQIRFLEIVTPDPDAVIAAYAAVEGLAFSGPVPEFGNSRIADLPDGGLLSVRAPLAEHEEPVVRPYRLVEDIEAALAAAVDAGAEVAHPPLEIPGRGTFAIYILGGVQFGLWQD